VGLQKFSPDARPHVPILFTAHSLPERIVELNDPYPDEVQATVKAVQDHLGTGTARFAYQSQGRSGEKWLGPTIENALEDLHGEGHRHVLVAPIGFICDHVETLYDLDIELKESAGRKGMQLERVPMLNASLPLIETLASVIEAHESSPVR